MAVTYEQLAKAFREEYPGKYSEDKWSNEELAKRFLNKDPNLKNYVTNLDQLYAPKAEERSEDYEFALYQLQEQFQGIPEWFVGSLAAVTGSENLGAIAEEMRAESAQWTEDYLANNPEIAGYLKWIEEEPVVFRGDTANWWHSDILQRSLAQAAPSMGTMIATEIALWGFTGGVGGVINKARQTGKFLEGFQTTNRLRSVGLGRKAATVSSMGVYEAAGEYSEAMSYLVDEKKMDPLDAQPVAAASAMVVGTINGIIEYMPYEMFKNKIFQGSAKKEANSRITRRVIDSFLKDRKIAKGIARLGEGAIVQGLAEGGQEWSQHMVQTLSQFAYKNGYGDTEETAFEEFIKQATSPAAISSAHAGGTMGLLMGPVAVVGQQLSARQKAALKRDPMQQMEDEYERDEFGNVITIPEDERPTDIKPEKVEDFTEREETLSRGQLVMRAFTGQNQKQMSTDNFQKLERVQEELGDITVEDPTVKQNWKDAITDVLQEDPGAFQDISNRDQALRSIEAEFGQDFRTEVEQAWEAPVPPEEVAPTEPVVIKEPVEKAPPKEAPKVVEAPMPPEVGEIKTMEDVGLEFPDEKKAPVEREVKPGLELIADLSEEDIQNRLPLDKGAKKLLNEVIDDAIEEHGNDKGKIRLQIRQYKNLDEALGQQDLNMIDRLVDLKTGVEEAPAVPAEAPVEGIPQAAFDALADQMQIAGINQEDQQNAIGNNDPSLMSPSAQLLAYHRLIELADKRGKGKAIRDAIEFEPEYQAFLDKQEAPAEEIKPIIPPLPTTREEKRLMASEAAYELQDLRKMEGVTIQRAGPKDEFRLGGIEVSDELKDQDIGTRYLNAKVKEFLSKGKGHMEIPVAPGSEGFWKKMGFEKIGISETAITHKGKKIFPDLMRMELAPIVSKKARVKEVAPSVSPEAVAQEPELTDIIKEAEPENVLKSRTGRWLRAERLFNRTWERVKTLYQDRYPNNISVGERIAVEHYMDAMEAGLPDWAQSGFLNWATKKFPLADINAWGPRDNEFDDHFIDDSIVHRLVDVALGEVSEGLEEIGKDRDFRYLNMTNTAFNKALGIILTSEESAKWYALAKLPENNTPQKWMENTLNDITGLDYRELNKNQIEALRYQYHNSRTSVPTNRENSSENFHNNGEIVLDGGSKRLQLKRSKHFVTKKTNPSRARQMLAGIDTDITWVSTSDIYHKRTVGPVGDRRVKIDSLYDPMSIENLQAFNFNLMETGKGVIAFVRGDSSLAIVKIKPEHKTIASKESTLRDYWKAEGLTDKQIANFMRSKRLNARASEIARYEVIKRYYPEFMEDKLDNVYKRLKIPFTPSIVANNTRDASVKILDSKNISYVYSDGRVVSWTKTLSDLDPLYAGDGGTPTSNDTFRHYNEAVGINSNSDVSKNVMYQVDDSGSLFVKHLMYKPQGPAQIYENYNKDNERLIGEIREDGNIYAYAEPKTWTAKKVDKLISDNNLANAKATDIINYFTDEEGNGMSGLSSAAEIILDDPKFEAMNLSTLNDKLEFISSKGPLLKRLVRKIANQGQEAEMEFIDHLMTKDEAKIATKDYENHIKNATTFTVSGQSVGYIQDVHHKHTKVKHNDQLYNYITDPGVIEAFRSEMLDGIVRKLNNVYRLGRGDVQSNLAALGSKMRKKKDESIDDILADGLEMGMGLHSTMTGWIDSVIQSRYVIPAIQMENQEGIAEKIQWDSKDELSLEELSVSSKNATIVYRDYAADPNTSANNAREAAKVDIKDINEWLEENEIWVLAYRVPTPHVNGAGMMRIKSIHNSRDVVLVNPDTIFRRFEGDGDGDTLYMHAMSPEMTAAFRSFYNTEEIRNKIKGINLKEFTEQDVKEYDFSNINDTLELTHSLMLGSKGISEIAKIQRIYGQLLAINPRIEVDGHEIVLRSPSEMIETAEFKKDSKYSVEDMLRIYLQAAVDNGKYMLLGKWGYKRSNLRKKLWKRTDGKDITDSQFVALNALMDIHGDTGNIRSGQTNADGVWGLSKMIEESNKHLLYVGRNEDGSLGSAFARESYFRDYLSGLEPFQRLGEDGKPYFPRIGMVEFNPGLSVQEEIVVQPALGYEKFSQSGEADRGSPFKLLDSLHDMAHIAATESIDQLKEDIEVTKEDGRKGIHYATNMGNAFYKMFRDLSKNNIDPGFLGWSTNEEMIKFRDTWQEKFNELSEDAKQMATFAFLEGIYRDFGQQRFVRQLPPISAKTDGITLLEPNIMKAYLKSYNETLMNPENRQNPKVKARSEFVALTSLMTKKRCK